jgi:hypothetical protein
MPFIAINLSVLSAANGFTLWHYRTTDSRTQTESAGYFTPAAERVRVGDVILVQANDGTTMLPVRAGNLTGTALVLDSLGAPPEIQRSANLPFTVTLSANAEARAIIIDPMPNAVEPGASIPAGVSIIGNISNVTFQLRNAAGTVIATVVVWGASSRVTAVNLPTLINAARDAARGISRKLGWSGAAQRRTGIVPVLKEDDDDEREREVSDDELAS